MHARPAEDDQGSLPDRLRPVGAREVGLAHLFERIHPGDLHVPTARYGLHAVFDLSALGRPELGPETDEVFLDLEPELLRDEEVAEFMERHQDGEIPKQEEEP